MAIPNTQILSTPTASINNLVDQLIPPVLRNSANRTLVYLMTRIIKPFSLINTDYNTFSSAKRRRLQYNGQVRLLENIINRLMLSTYNMSAPVIYLTDQSPVEEFYISPNGNWIEQESIHYDQDGKIYWDMQQHDPEEEPKHYSILHDRTCRADTIGFEVHLTPPLAPDAPTSTMKTRYYNNGGDVALKEIVDTYKIAGKHYVVIQDTE